jgi:hypothetical protein
MSFYPGTSIKTKFCVHFSFPHTTSWPANTISLDAITSCLVRTQITKASCTVTFPITLSHFVFIHRHIFSPDTLNIYYFLTESDHFPKHELRRMILYKFYSGLTENKSSLACMFNLSSIIWFQVSAAKQMKSAFLWVITQRKAKDFYRSYVTRVSTFF